MALLAVGTLAQFLIGGTRRRHRDLALIVSALGAQRWLVRPEHSGPARAPWQRSIGRIWSSRHHTPERSAAARASA